MPQELSDRLARLAQLPHDWDSYGAVPISADAIARTKATLRRILALGGKAILMPFIAPSPDGGLELEWTMPSGKELMLEIPPEEGPMAFLLVEHTALGGEEETEGTLGEPYSLEEVVRRLLVG